jgi:hypothetical protein
MDPSTCISSQKDPEAPSLTAFIGVCPAANSPAADI